MSADMSRWRTPQVRRSCRAVCGGVGGKAGRGIACLCQRVCVAWVVVNFGGGTRAVGNAAGSASRRRGPHQQLHCHLPQRAQQLLARGKLLGRKEKSEGESRQLSPPAVTSHGEKARGEATTAGGSRDAWLSWERTVDWKR